MILSTPADFSGDGVAHKLSDIPGITITQCKWFQVLGVSIANSSIPGRIGDSGISLDVISPAIAGRGIIIPATGGQFNPPIAIAEEFYDLTEIYYILASGDKAQFAAAV